MVSSRFSILNLLIFVKNELATSQAQTCYRFYCQSVRVFGKLLLQMRIIKKNYVQFIKNTFHSCPSFQKRLWQILITK